MTIPRQKIHELADDIKRACDAGTRLNTAGADPEAWARAVELLIAHSDFRPARYAAGQFLAVRPDLAYAQNIADILDRMPRGATGLAFQDDPGRDVQVVPRTGSNNVIVVFADRGDGAGVPFPIAHAWFGRLPASLIYLRDFRRLFFRDGVPHFGDGRQATTAGLKSIIQSLGARRVLCYGCSAGGFAALDYALDLEAVAVLGISGSYNLSPDFPIKRDWRSREYLSHPISQQAVDLRERYSRAANPPQTMLVYGADNPVDRTHAEYMAGARNVTLAAVEDCRMHMLVIELIRRGTFERALQWLVHDRGAAASGASKARL